MLVVQRHERASGKRLSRPQLIGGMHLRAWLVVHHREFCFIEVEHLAKLLRDLKLVAAVLRRKGLLGSNPDQFLRIGLNVTALRHGKAERRCSQDIRDKPKTLSIPRIQEWTGAFLT